MRYLTDIRWAQCQRQDAIPPHAPPGRAAPTSDWPGPENYLHLNGGAARHDTSHPIAALAPFSLDAYPRHGAIPRECPLHHRRRPGDPGSHPELSTTCRRLSVQRWSAGDRFDHCQLPRRTLVQHDDGNFGALEGIGAFGPDATQSGGKARPRRCCCQSGF